ncbi:hypothetical protein TNCV_679051 [Trichonephila clavipes]|nr:hypothetical protein TNCV_679051 [Trichonephila clavipes]
MWAVLTWFGLGLMVKLRQPFPRKCLAQLFGYHLLPFSGIMYPNNDGIPQDDGGPCHLVIVIRIWSALENDLPDLTSFSLSSFRGIVDNQSPNEKNFAKMSSDMWMNKSLGAVISSY